jgi:hypothetical protein
VHDLSIRDNDQYAFRENAAARRCHACNGILDKWAAATKYHPKRAPRLDLGCTYDGVIIASDKAADFLRQSGIAGVELVPLAKGNYFVKVSLVVRFDFKAKGTAFENQCVACGQFESVTGATPPVLCSGEIVPDNGIVRTDLEFGSNDEKSPVLLCGEAAAGQLARANLKGLVLVRC